MRHISFCLALVLFLGAYAPAQFVQFGSSTQLNGTDPVFGFFGQVETRYNGVLSEYAFWKPANGKIQVLPYPAGSLSGIDAHCMAGTFTNEEDFNIAGFQQCTDENGKVQYFEFVFGADATVITTQLHGSQAVAGYFDNFHLQDTGFISTPVFDSSGAVKYYNTTNYAVPGSASTMLLTATQTEIAGSFENSQNHWSGFIQPIGGGAITVINFPGAVNTGITALGSKFYAGYYDIGDGAHHGFVHCSDFVPIDLGDGGTWITQIGENGDLVGYFQKAQGYQGFVWKGFAR